MGIIQIISNELDLNQNLAITNSTQEVSNDLITFQIYTKVLFT